MLDTGRNLTHQLTHQIGQAIVQGQYAIDKPFPTEADLSAQYNISRSVTREAVKMLTAKGLIASRPRQGIRVMPSKQWNMFDADVLRWTLNTRPSLRLLQEFNQLRMALEPEAAVLASANHRDSDCMSLISRALMRVKLASVGQDDALAAAVDFHGALLQASDNRFFIQLRDFIQVSLRITYAGSSLLKSDIELNYDDYRGLFDAIREGRGDLAATIVRELLQRTQQLIDASLTRVAPTAAAIG